MTTPPIRRRLTSTEWVAEAAARFGRVVDDWAFACPACGIRQTVGDLKAVGAPRHLWGIACIGRFAVNDAANHLELRRIGGGCSYIAGAGVAVCPLQVTRDDGTVVEVFDFAPSVIIPGKGRT